MGNKKSQTQLVSEEKSIILTPNHTLSLNQLVTFPHGFDGLHIWQAGIVLARYIVTAPQQTFLNKEVLELGSGVGIGGIAVLKYTKAKYCHMSDYSPEVCQNIRHNSKRNGFPDALVIKLDWKDHTMFDKQYDLIIGSDIVYFGCPVADLYQTIKKRLRKGGKAMIVIPERKNYAELFLKQVEEQAFKTEKVKLDAQIYKKSPLQNQQEGMRLYNLLKEIDFYIYIFEKLKQ